MVLLGQAMGATFNLQEVGGQRLAQADSKGNHHYWKVCRVFSLWQILTFYLTELGVNFSHIRDKSMTVLNPLRGVDEHIMDDADLAGPLIFCFCFGTCLLFVSDRLNPIQALANTFY